ACELCLDFGFGSGGSEEMAFQEVLAPREKVFTGTPEQENNLLLSTADLERCGTRQKTIHISLQLRSVRWPAPHPLPNKHGADHDIGGGKPVAKQVRPLTQFSFDDVFDCLEIGPTTLSQGRHTKQRITHSGFELRGRVNHQR